MDTRALLADARRQTDLLFDVVRPDSLYERPIAERHRIIFYLGHLEAFDWNLLRPHMPHGDAFHAAFDRLFAFGIDPVGGGLPSDAPSDWPEVAEIQSYNRRIRQTLDGAVHDRLLLHMAMEHRLMHAETLAYMLHQLPLERKCARPQVPLPQAALPGSEAVRNELIGIPAGRATLGMADHGGFGWDNEFEAHPVEVPAFAIQRYKVTNGDYLRFMEAGGYQDQSLWRTGAWQWRTGQNITHPAFWSRAGAEWRYRTMFDEIELPLDWPVYVSHAEASAYAQWAGLRLPTEAEWHRAAYGTGQGTEREFPWGDEPPGPQHGYFNFARWDPAPVQAFPCAPQRLGARWPAGERLGMDVEPVCALPRIQAASLLLRLLRRFLRRQALRSQGRFGAHSRVHAAPLFPQLVPAALPVCLCGIPVREGSVSHGIKSAGTGRSIRLRGRHPRRPDQTRPEGTRFEVPLRRPRARSCST